MINQAQLLGALQRVQMLHQAGRIDEAWRGLAPLRAAIADHGQGLRLYVLVAQAANDTDAAAEALRRIIKIERDPPEIIGALADLLGNAGHHDQALPLWTKLVSLQPNVADAHLNRAVTAANAGQHQQAVAAATEGLKRFPGHARLLATRAMALKNAGRIEEALVAFDRAIAADPDRALTRHNQAVTLRAASRFDDACDAYAASARLGMAGAQFHANWAAAALEAGQVEDANQLYEMALADDPGHEESLSAMTRLHIEYRTGADPFGHYAALAQAQANSPNAWLRWANALALNKDYARAADVAGQGLARHETDLPLRIVTAFSRGMADDARGPMAELRALHELFPDNELLWATISQLGLRAGRPELAAEAALRMTARDPFHQTAWSILSLAWRLLDDPREHWLCDYERLVMQVEVTPPDGSLSAADYARAVADVLRPLHTTLEAPGNQSLRQGTQTAGSLFDNNDPAIQRFRQAVSDAAARAVTALPDDPDHPFLSRKATSFRFNGSWSVRLRAGGGHHVPHFHSEGWMSSAYYARLPDPTDGASPDEGWIEFGRPPPIFNLGLGPRKLVEPKAGLLVLFPSYMWHGTIPFGAGERLTAAFDYLPQSGSD